MKAKNNNKRNVPNLRFPEFENRYSSYKKYLFKDIFLFSTGKNIKQNEASPDFETPCVRYGELYHLYNEVITEVFNKTNLAKSELNFSDGDEILLPSAGEDPLDIGLASALTIKNVAIGRTINILKPAQDNIYSQPYVAYYINQKLRKTISTLAKGVSISNVYNSDLKTLEIILPNLQEQKKVANFIALLNQRVQTQREIIEGLDSLKIALRKNIFRQQLRFSNCYEEWKSMRLGEICEKQSSNISANKIEDNSGDYIIYGATGRLKQVDFYQVEDNFIGIVKDGAGVGRLFYCDKKSSVLGTLDIIKPKKNVNTYFLYCLLLTVDFTKYITGSTIPHIYFKDYANEIVEIPPLTEQIKIANALSAIGRKVEIETILLQKLNLQKQYLLQQLFI